jgi:hypothetical protein
LEKIFKTNPLAACDHFGCNIADNFLDRDILFFVCDLANFFICDDENCFAWDTMVFTKRIVIPDIAGITIKED